MSETQENGNESDMPENKMELDDKTTACRKRKRSAESIAKPQKLSAEATTETETETDTDTESDSDSDTDSEENRVTVTNQRACRLDSFEIALDNFINYHIEIEQAEEDRVIILRQTMSRIYEILRSSSYYTGALVEGLEQQDPRF